MCNPHMRPHSVGLRPCQDLRQMREAVLADSGRRAALVVPGGGGGSVDGASTGCPALLPAVRFSREPDPESGWDALVVRANPGSGAG